MLEGIVLAPRTQIKESADKVELANGKKTRPGEKPETKAAPAPGKAAPHTSAASEKEAAKPGVAPKKPAPSKVCEIAQRRSRSAADGLCSYNHLSSL